MEDIKNKLKYFIVPVVLLFVVLLFVKQSYSLDELRETVTLSSEHANYYNDEHNSWELQKSAYWINANEAEIKMEVHSNPYDGTISDYIFLIDMGGSDNIQLVKDFLTNNTPIDSNISLIFYNQDDSVVYLSQETNMDTIMAALDVALDNAGDGYLNVEYYGLLLRLEYFLENYTFIEGHKTKVIFVGYPYEGVFVHNQEEQMALIRENYPDIKFYYANTDEITTTGFLNSHVDYVGNDLELITSASVIKDFVVTDFIDTTYFEYEEVIESTYKYFAYQMCHWEGIPLRGDDSCTPGDVYVAPKSGLKSGNKAGFLLNDNNSKTSPLYPQPTCVCVNNYYDVPTNTVKYDEENNKVTWDLSDSIYSTNAVLRLKVKLKDEYVGSEDIFTTNKSTRVVSNLNEIEEDVSTNDSPELKYYYTVTYDGNMPSGCSWTNVVESHAIYSTVDVIDGPSSCNGYTFHEWVIDYTDEYGNRIIDSLINGSFEMPTENVIIKAIWSKTGVQKSFDGDEYGSYAITEISTKTLNNSNELASPNYTRNKTNTNVRLNNLDSVAEYTVTAANLSGKNYRIEIVDINSNNPNITCEIVGGKAGIVANSSTSFTIRVKYNDELTEVPDNKDSIITVTYKFVKDGAMFISGRDFNAKIKRTVHNGAWYDTQDYTIKSIDRYYGTPDPMYLNTSNAISLDNDDFPDSIYMWYDSSTNTIYWYTEATNIFFNYDSSYLLYQFCALDSLLGFEDISSIYTTNMANMFSSAGASNTTLSLHFGDKFDTRNVTNMKAMFYGTGYHSSSFTLDLGNKFDTSNVTDMSYMFLDTGYKSSLFTLNLGDKFDTSKVTDMTKMFSNTGFNNPNFTLDLRDKFDTSNVTNMSQMFSSTGKSSTKFSLHLGDKFDTSNVTNMYAMFYNVGYSNPSYTVLDLGNKFDTSNVTDMTNMFTSARYIETIYVPNTFVTSVVTRSDYMFNDCTNLVGGAGTAYSSTYDNAAYAHIDGGPSNPGYFTDRNQING